MPVFSSSFIPQHSCGTPTVAQALPRAGRPTGNSLALLTPAPPLRESNGRSIAPVVKAPTRGNRSSRLALDEAFKATILDAYECDTRANSAWGPNGSLLKTWAHFHNNWFACGDEGLAVPAIPVTIDSIRGVVAQMKELGYRSIPNYLSAVKDRHVSAGHQGCDLLD